jgi:protein-S-isoprenylcysteine O-methyltransferase Ste14
VGVFSWPALCIAIIVGAYWARVLKLVYKSYKKTGHNAGLWPAESTGRALRFIWFPAISLWFVIPLVVAFRGARLLWSNRVLEWTGVAIAIIAFGATLVCWRRMGKSWRMGIDPGERTQLVFTGPYAYVRHPIYSGILLAALGTALAGTGFGIGLFVFASIIFLSRIGKEEKIMLGLFPNEYPAYQARTKRLVPFVW